MDQGGFDFRKPSERRDARRFEPPPWEQAAFDELRRKREAEEERTKKDVEQAGRSAAECGAVEELTPEASVGEEPESAPVTKADADSAAPGGEVDEARMIELMAGLASETPGAKRLAAGLMLGFGALLSLFGVGLTAWGGVSMARAQGSGRWLAMVLVVMGLAYLGVGAGLGYRALKERGVL